MFIISAHYYCALKVRLLFRQKKNVFYVSTCLTKQNKGRKRKMNRKLLTGAISAAVLLAIAFSMGLAHAGYFYVDYNTGDFNWNIDANNNIYFDDSTYVIDQYSSYVDSSASIWWPGSFDLTQQTAVLTNYNSEAYIQGVFSSWPYEWHADACAWTYPSYWQEPWGGWASTW
jgi:hypothetical protein